MATVITSTTFADEFNAGTSTNLNANVSDVITTTINLYEETTFDAGRDASYNMTMTNTATFGNVGNIVLTFNSDFGGVIDDRTLNNLVGREVTTLNFINANYTSIVKSVGSSSMVLEATNVASAPETSAIGVVYFSGNVEAIDFEYLFSEGGSSPSIDGNGYPVFSTPTNILDASDTGTIHDIPAKYNGAFNTGSLTVQGKGKITSGNIYNRQSFEIVHITQATPISIYNDGSTTQPEDLSLDYINGSALFVEGRAGNYKANIILKENPSDIGIDFTQAISSFNQSSAGSIIDIFPQVSTFNQKYLQGATDYSTSNFSIIRTSDSEDSGGVPLVNAKFTVAFDIDNTGNVFSDGNTKVKIGIENIPDSLDETLDYTQAFLSDSVIATLGDAAATGTATGNASSITNYTATYNSATSISISFDVEFSANAITQINNSSIPYFSIYAETQNYLLGYTDSDRVVLQPFSGEGIPNILLDPATVNGTQFITAPYNDFSTGIDASAIDGFKVQLLTGSTNFSLDWTNRPELRLTSVEQKLVLKNTSTLEEIELDTTTIPVSVFNLINGEYPDTNNYSVLKGFKIPNDEVRNKIEMVNISDVSNVRTFEVFFPFFIRWEDYTKLITQDIPSSILDSNEPFNGVNYDINRIDDIANWEVDYRITINSEESGVVFSQDFDYTIPTSNYNEHPDVLSRSIDSFEEDGVTSLEVSGEKYIDSKNKTVIVGTWNMNYTPTAITEFEIEFYIEAFENGSPTKIQRISSVNDLLSSSWFSSTTGDGLVTKSISGDSCIGTVYIDNTKLVNYESYTIYGTFYNPKRPDEGLLVESGDSFITEGGDFLIEDF